MTIVAAIDPLAYADDQDRLAALRALGVLDTTPQPALEMICQLAADRFRAPIALVSLVDDHRQWFAGRYGLNLSETPRSESFCMHTMASCEIMVVPDAQNDPRFAANSLVRGDPHIRFYAGAPLVLTGGHRIGALCIIDSQPRKNFSQRDRHALALMARQVLEILESDRARREQVVSDLIARTTSDAFVCSDESGRVVLWNRGAQEMFGWTGDEVLGQDVDRLMGFYSSDGETAWSRLADAGTNAPATALAVYARRKDGSSVPVELSIATWSSDNRRDSSGVAAIMRDVSGARQAQARLAEQISALNASDDGIALTDAEGLFVFMNRAHAEMFGYESPDQLFGTSWNTLYPARELERLQREVMPVLGSEGQWRGRTQGLKADGSIVEQEVTLSLSGEGGIVCITRDISQRLALEREKAILAETLMVRQRQEVVGQLASGIAHDFNNIIAVIAGTAEMLESHNEEAVRGYASRIQAAAMTASRMVEKLLTLGRRRQTPKQVNLCGVARDIAQMLQPSLKDRQHEILIELPSEPIWSCCDETEVTQMIMNLLVNSRDALTVGEAGRIVLEVKAADEIVPSGPVLIGSFPNAPAALIKVSDNGSGIPEEILPHIFEPFFSGKGDAGTGLGLAVAASIANANGGAISVKSALGAGTNIEIWWPIQGHSETGWSPVYSGEADNFDLSGITVMVVDDNQIVVETVTNILEDMRAEVGPCLEPADAITALTEGINDWDLLITDYDMPGMNGYELAQAARSMREDIPILLLTGLPVSIPLCPSGTSVFAGRLSKPVQPDELKQAVRAAISATLERQS
jgi:PAS domain S-box-containing protein